MDIKAPLTTQLLLTKHGESGREYLMFINAVETFNKALAEKKIWNVEFNDSKRMLAGGFERAINVGYDIWLNSRSKSWQYEDWNHDFCSYCGLNQAAGRIKRLTKLAPKTRIVIEHINILQEIAAANEILKAIKSFIVKGRRPNENKTEAMIAEELANTGICAICGNRQKLDNDRMVHHGYKMSDYNHSGYRIGSCFCVGYLCYELSNEANVAFAPVLQRQLQNYKTQLKDLRKVETLIVQRTKWVNHQETKEFVTLVKGTDEFTREQERMIAQTKRFIEYTKSDIVINDAKISDWTLQPLKYGREGNKK